MDHDSTNFLKTVSLCCVCLCKYVLSFQPLHPSEVPLCPMTGWVCQWKPLTHSRRPIWKEWVFISDAPSEGPSSADQGEVIPEILGCRSLPLRHLWSQRSPRIKHVFGNVLRHRCLRCGHDLNVISLIRNSSVPFAERLELPSSNDAILSGYEDLVSSGSNHFTLWVKMSPHEILPKHVVNIHKVVADFRDDFERK